jgi:hypothetical protein
MNPTIAAKFVRCQNAFADALGFGGNSINTRDKAPRRRAVDWTLT